MQTDSGTTVAVSLALLLFGSVLAAQQTTPQAVSSDNVTAAVTSSQPPPPAATDSEVRIVRLSQLQGEVEIDRSTGQGFEPALLNLPITQGAQLRTGAGLAEVEFEDNSTVRLTPNSLVGFPQLQRRESGATASEVNVEAGTVYVSLGRTKGNEFMLICGSQKIRLAPSSHIRLTAQPTEAGLAVLGGKAQLEEPTGTMAVEKSKTAVLDLANPAAPTVSKGVAPWTYDSWDKAAIGYHDQRVKSSAYGNSPHRYGLNDLRYYGRFVHTECGLLWQPYFVSPAWDPFANGTWVWFPGSGYTWVSPYPWGWTPYHYGGWEYCSDYGWGWRPRGVWQGLRNIREPQAPRKPIHGHRPPRGGGPPRLPKPPKAPDPGTIPKALTVSHAPLVASSLRSPGRFVIPGDSAGLGIPRGTLGNLGRISAQFEQHSSAKVAVTSTPMIAGNERESHSGPMSPPEKTSPSRTAAGSFSHERSDATSYSKGIRRGPSGADTGRGAPATQPVRGGGGSTTISGGGGHGGSSAPVGSGGGHSGGSAPMGGGGGHSGGSTNFGGGGGSGGGSATTGGGGAYSGGSTTTGGGGGKR